MLDPFRYRLGSRLVAKQSYDSSAAEADLDSASIGQKPTIATDCFGALQGTHLKPMECQRDASDLQHADTPGRQ